jgi:hypothetical protein
MEQGTKMEDLTVEQQTAADALWGYRDQHGKWTAGLTQRVAVIEQKQNITMMLVAASLGRLAWPDLLKLVMSTAQASGLH